MKPMVFDKQKARDLLALVARENPTRNAMTLIAQLFGVPVCEVCDYVKTGCRCGREHTGHDTR